MKRNLAVFFGGRSVEHEVSVITGVQAMMSLNREKYNVIPVYIAKNGSMYSGDMLFDIDNYKDLDKLTQKVKRVTFCSEDGKAVMKFAKKLDFTHKGQIEIDVALPAVHGTNCEDGTLQGFLEMLNIPYAGCNVLASAVGMDKGVFKNVMQQNNVPVLPCVQISAREYSENPESFINKVKEDIGFPAIVKPANLGSSVGISKADDIVKLTDSVELAFSFAERVLVERAVENLKELNCSVLGDENECIASVCEEPAMSGDILSYEDKYMSGGKSKTSGGSKGMASLSRKLPADIDEKTASKIKEIACLAYKALGASGVCRIDFLMDTKTNDIYVNEANTVPGSLAFYLWEASGLKYSDMLDKMIDAAYKRKRRHEKLMYTVDANLLANNALSGFKNGKTGK